jgi:CrcB protein
VSLTSVVAVAAGGMVGAPSRYLLDRFVSLRRPSTFPWGTLVINCTGSLVLGVLAGASAAIGAPLLLSAGLGVGFCGAFTTFSTFTFEAVALLEEGQLAAALLYLGGSLLLGLAAAAAGFGLGQLL